MKKIHIHWILILTLFIIGLFSIRIIANLDTGFHLVTGKYIIEHFSVPLYDVFSYTAQNARLIAHYWLSDVVFFLVFQLGGYVGLMVSAGIISVLAYAMLYRAGRAYTQKKNTPILLLILGFLTFELWVVRPQIFSYLFTALLLLLLVLYDVSGKKRWLCAIVPLMLVWGNAHAGVVLGMALVGWYGVLYIVEHRREIKQHIVQIALFVASISIPFLNPNGYKTILYSRIISASVEHMQIAEWKSIFFYVGITWQSTAYLCLMALSLILFALRIKKINIAYGIYKTVWMAGLLVVALVLPIISIRHVGFFSFLVYMPIVVALGTISFPLERIQKIITTACVLFLVLMSGYGIYRCVRLPTINAHILPEGAAEFVQRQHIVGNMFNTQPTGGWLMWKLWPERKVYYDGRNELYTGELDGEMWGIVSNTKDPMQIFEKRGITYVIMHYRDPFSIVPAPAAMKLFMTLTQKGNFKLVFWDDAALVLVQASGANKKIADEFGYTYINPFLIKNGTKQDIAREFNRALTSSPDSDLVRLTAQSIISQF